MVKLLRIVQRMWQKTLHLKLSAKI